MAILQESAGQTDGLTPPLDFIRARRDVKACLIHFRSHADLSRAEQPSLSLDGTRAQTFPLRFNYQRDNMNSP